MNATCLLGTLRRSVGSAILLLGGAAWLLLPAFVDASERDAATFPDEPAAHEAYHRMIEAMHQAGSLSYTSRLEREVGDSVRASYTYRMWLKKPNFFRMEARSATGELEGILIGDGARLWIYWPKGRPQWKYVVESEADRKTRLTSYMTKAAPRGRHSILHEAQFLATGLGFPILDASVFHGHVDSLERYLDAVRGVGAEMIGGEDCDKIEISFMNHQRSWYLWLSKRDHLPRRLKEVVRVTSNIVTHEEWSSVILGAEIPEGTFAWTPPTGWTEWKRPNEEDGHLKAGDKAPDFDLTAVDGGRIKLSDFRGKAVWLCFWRVGCPPCREEMPFLQSLYVKNRDRGLVVLGVNVSDDRAIAREFLRERGVTFPNILDASPVAEEAYSRDYGVGTIPLNYLIDGDGLVIDGWVGNLEGHARVVSALRRLGFGTAGSKR